MKKRLKWLKNADSTSLQSSLRYLDNAFNSFFNKERGYPKFKTKKYSKKSYETKNKNGGNSIQIRGNRIKLPKLGYVKFSDNRKINCKILNATITLTRSGKFYASIKVKEDIKEYDKTESFCGVDLGIKDLAILSNGVVYNNIKALYLFENKLMKEFKKLGRKKEGSKNWEKQRIKVSKIHEKISNIRRDNLHKISTDIVKSHDFIGLEDLQVDYMLSNKFFSKAIYDAGWGTLRSMIEYKAVWYGKKVVIIDKFFPSSKMCSSCGKLTDKTKDVNVREWICENCGETHDRDLNAAINIKNEAMRILTEGDSGLAC